MTTFSDLVNDVATYLYGYGLERDKETSLVGPLDPSSTTFTVTDGAQVDRGYVEIDDELIGVQASDRSAGLITCHAWGRGANGTTATNHADGSRVASNPRFPRSRIKATINQVINTLYPALYAIDVDGTNFSRVARVTYPINADAQSVVSLSVQTIGPSQMWRPVTRYRFDFLANAGAFSTGKSIDIYESLPPGRQLKIIYRKQFGQFTADTQTFADIGLDEGWRDLIAIGAEARLLPAIDSARLNIGTIESKTQAQYDQPGTATQTARSLALLYQQRLKEEQDQLLRQYPGSMVRMS